MKPYKGKYVVICLFKFSLLLVNHKISPTCEPLAVGFCLNRTTYRSTYLPNFLGHRSQNEAMSYSYSISELSQNKCYDYATDFWCAILAPECVNGAGIPPCRSFCEGEYHMILTFLIFLMWLIFRNVFLKQAR